MNGVSRDVRFLMATKRFRNALLQRMRLGVLVVFAAGILVAAVGVFALVHFTHEQRIEIGRQMERSLLVEDLGTAYDRSSAAARSYQLTRRDVLRNESEQAGREVRSRLERLYRDAPSAEVRILDELRAALLVTEESRVEVEQLVAEGASEIEMAHYASDRSLPLRARVIEVIDELRDERMAALARTYEGLDRAGEWAGMMLALVSALALGIAGLTARRLHRRAEQLQCRQVKLHAALTKAVEERDDLLAMASHDLRTPLAALNLQLEALRRKLPETDVAIRERATGATRSVGKALALLDDLLDLSKLQSGRLELDPEPIELTALVDEVVARVTPGADAPPVTVHAHDAVRGRWDRLRLERVLQNLLSNAVKYGRGRPIEVDVSETAAEVVVAVRDQGIGLTPEERETVFERHARTESGRRTATGTGLGLWIVRRLVEAHGGRVDVESAPGAGSTFTVRLPHVVDAAA